MKDSDKPAGKSPAFQYYPKDFLCDTAMMTNEQVGIYWRLCSYAWIGLPGYKQCHLPTDPFELAMLVHITPEGWFEIGPRVVQCFIDNKDGTMYHKRLLEEAGKQRRWKEKSRTGGISSGKSRRSASKGGFDLVREKTNQTRTKREPKPNSSSSSSTPVIRESKSHWRRRATPADERSQHPAIQAVRDLVCRYPDKSLWDRFIENLGTDIDQTKLRGCYERWVASGYNKLNFSWVFDWYKNGIPEVGQNGRRQGTGRVPNLAKANPDDYPD